MGRILKRKIVEVFKALKTLCRRMMTISVCPMAENKITDILPEPRGMGIFDLKVKC